MTTSDEHGHHDHARSHGDQDHAHDHGLFARLRHVMTPHSHDAADSIDDALEASNQGMQVLRRSLLALLATAVLQAVAFGLSGSVALLADTIHNFTDALTAIPLGIAFWAARRPPNDRYSYGFGRAEDLAGAFIVFVIAVSAAVASWQAIDRLANPQSIDHLGWVAAAGIIGFVGNELVARYRINVGRSIGSAALVADGIHARTDGFTSLAVVVGAIGVALGWKIADPVIGLIIALAILGVLRGAAREVYRRLMDATDPELLASARHTLLHVAGIVSTEQLKMRWIGHRLHAEALVLVNPSLAFVEAAAIVSDAEQQLLQSIPKLATVTISARPSNAD